MIAYFKKNQSLKIRDYALLGPQEKEFIDYTISNSLKPNAILNLGSKKIKPIELDFWKLTWNNIILLRHHIGKNDMKAIHKMIYGIEETDFINLDLLNSSACYKWIVKQMNAIHEVEKIQLEGKLSDEEIDAGAERLNDFGYSISLYGFRGTDITKDEELLNTPYAKIFKEICMRKVIGEVNKQQQENARRKNKRNNRGF